MKLPKFLRGDEKPAEDTAKKPEPVEPAKAKATSKLSAKATSTRRTKPPAAKPIAVKKAEPAKTKPKRRRTKSTKGKPKSDPKAQLAAKVAKPDPEAASPKASRRRSKVAKPDPKPAAPSRKRRAPAKRAAAAGTQARRAGAALSSTLKEGTEETRGRTRAATPGLTKGLLKLLGTVFGIFFDALAFVLNILIALAAIVADPGMKLVRGLRRIVDALSALLTPRRALALVVLGATVLLALSQYADYRVISTGSAEYKNVELVAPAPEINREPTGDAHSYVFVPVAAVCVLLLGGALRGRWRLCRLIAIAGLAAIVVALLIDRPAGLDLGDSADKFASVEATLLGGYYAQIFAGLLLALSSLMLGRQLRLEGATAGSKATRSDRKRRGAGIARRRTPTEGAQA